MLMKMEVLKLGEPMAAAVRAIAIAMMATKDIKAIIAGRYFVARSAASASEVLKMVFRKAVLSSELFKRILYQLRL